MGLGSDSFKGNEKGRVSPPCPALSCPIPVRSVPEPDLNGPIFLFCSVGPRTTLAYLLSGADTPLLSLLAASRDFLFFFLAFLAFFGLSADALAAAGAAAGAAVDSGTDQGGGNQASEHLVHENPFEVLHSA
jgi:hypothetical protein